MAVLRQTDSGTVTLGAGSGSQTATLNTTLLDKNKAFLVFGVSGASPSPALGFVAGEITNTTTLTFDRWTAAGSPAIVIRWWVAEFTSGVTVQHGNIAISSTSVDVTISAVNLAKTFPIISFKNSGTAHNGDDWIKAKVTTTTNLNLAPITNSNSNSLLRWQVVEYDGCTIQEGLVAFANGDASKTATVVGADATRDLLIMSYNSGDGTTANIGQKFIRGRITDATTLTFDRANTGQAVNVQYYLIRFTDGTRVQQVDVTHTSAVVQNDTGIAAVTVARSIVTAAGWYNAGGKNTYSADDDGSPGMGTFELTSTTNVRTTRSIHGSVGNEWVLYVVSFTNVAILPPKPTVLSQARQRAATF